MSRLRAVPDAAHERAQADLPWYVAGTLDDAAAGRLRRHVEECSACRDELAREQQLAASLRATPTIELAPQPALSRLMDRIDAHEARRSRLEPLRRWLASLDRPLLVAAVGAQAVAIAILVGWIVVMAASTPPQTYRTLTTAPIDAASVATGPAIPPRLRVVFAPDTTVARMGELLAGIGGTLVAGPGRNGAYTVALPAGAGSDDLRDAAAVLEATTDVRLAQPVLP